MHSDILNDYLNKDVEVSIGNKTHEGNMKLHDSNKGVVVLSPLPSRYRRSKEFGDLVIRQQNIVSIREILPQIDEEDDLSEDKQMVGQWAGDSSESESESDDMAYTKSASVDSVKRVETLKKIEEALKKKLAYFQKTTDSDKDTDSGT